MQSTAERKEDEPVVASDRSAKVLAKTLYRELRSNGLEERAVLTVATELLGLVAADLRDGD